MSVVERSEDQLASQKAMVVELGESIFVVVVVLADQCIELVVAHFVVDIGFALRC